MHMTAMTALLSHWRRRPIQLLTLVVGLALATALWSAVEAINAEARASYARAAALLGQNRLDGLASVDGRRLDEAIFVKLRRAGWLVSPMLEGVRRFGSARIKVLGIDPLTLPAEAQAALSSPGSLAGFLSRSGLVLAAPETADKLRGMVTQEIREAADVPPGVAITDIGQAQALLDAPGQISRLVLAPEQPMGQPPLETLAPELVRKAPSAAGDIARLTDSLHLNLKAFGLLSFAVGLFIVHATIGLAFEQRRPLVRTLRALGVPGRTLMGLMLAELALLAVAGGVIGVALGYAVAAALLPDVAATLSGLYGASVAGSLTLRGSSVAEALAMALAGTLMAAGQGLWRLTSLPLLVSAQPQAWLGASERVLRLQIAAAAVLYAVAGAIHAFGTGLFWGFVLMGVVLLASALALPWLLMLVLTAGARLSAGPLQQWFWADTRQQLSGLSLALMALLLALATNVGVGTMVSSFRQTFVGWLDQRLASELYVSARSEKEAAAIGAWLAARADAVLPIAQAEGQIEGQPVTIYGVADHATYREHWPLIASGEDTWDKVAKGRAVLVNEQLARRMKLGPGDTITIPGGWRTTIAGIYSDYGNPLAQVMIGIEQLTSRYPEAQRLRFAVRVDPAKAAVVAGDLKETFDLPEETVIDQAGVKALSIATFERTFTVTAALNVLTLGIAGVAMLASLLTLASMRVTQVAPVWAIGVTKSALARLEVVRSALLAALTAIVSVPLGLALAWVLLTVVNVEAFGWRLPMFLFPNEWLTLGVMAMLAAVLAAALPALTLARLSPSALLKVFADER